MNLKTKKRAAGWQELHSAGTCPTCNGRGDRLFASGGGAASSLLPCGPCNGSGRTR
jgi:DnaJ-class molecular chaperone